jgi:cytochrome c-type biogenesis protein CcmH
LSFWIPAGLLVLVSLATLLYPLLRKARSARASKPTDRGSYERNVYRDLFSEIERDQARGLIDTDEAEAARVEIGRRLLASEGGDTTTDGDANKVSAASEGSPRLLTAGIIGIIGVGGALALYLSLGSPGTPDQPLAERHIESPTMADVGDFADAVTRLSERMAQEPDNLEGWLLLGRSLSALQRYSEAATAFAQALRLNPDDDVLRGNLAEAQVFAAEGVVTAAAQDNLRQLLSRNPHDSRARFYLALAKIQTGDREGGLKEWLELEASAPADAPWRGALSQQIDNLAGQMGLDPASLRPDRPAVAAQDPSSSDPSAEAVAETQAAMQGMSEGEQGAMIRSMVTRLAERLAESPDDPDGWQRLIRSYAVLGEADNARGALAEARSALGAEHQASLDRLASELGLSAGAGQTSSSGPSAEEVAETQAAMASMSKGEQGAMIRSMVARLAERLSESPDDPEGWQRLIRSYAVLGEPEEAQEALTQARAALGAEDQAALDQLAGELGLE